MEDLGIDHQTETVWVMGTNYYFSTICSLRLFFFFFFFLKNIIIILGPQLEEGSPPPPFLPPPLFLLLLSVQFSFCPIFA
jgi:hypothetical protein